MENKFTDALRGYAYNIHKRDGFKCRYCGLDGAESLANWLHLSEDHLLPKGHPDRDHQDFIVTSCRFCNEAHNRKIWDIEGKTPAELVEQKKFHIQEKRNEYKKFWNENVCR